MWQLSKRQWLVLKGWQSITSALLRSTGWPVSSVHSTRAEVATSSFFRARQCSASQCFRLCVIVC